MARNPLRVIVVMAAVTLWWLRPQTWELPARLTAAASWASWLHAAPLPVLLTVALDGLGWLVLGWLALAAGLIALSQAPGKTGRLATRLANRLTPRLARRAAAALLGGALGGATLPAAVLPGPAWAAQGHPVPTVSTSWPSLDWPSRSAAKRSPNASEAAWAARRHVAVGRSRDVPAASRGVGPTARGTPSADVVVHPGDTLWRIAAEHLPAGAPAATVAATWPRWYSANAALIGPDPNLIHPGQVLRPPAGASSLQEH